jgi:ABC-type polysaccharide/polyol phosphate transport system ATPase subunit
MSSNTAISAEGVSKVYRLYDKPADRFYEALFFHKRSYGRDFWALNDVSFTIKEGESVGIIGRNGSGKSTLLQILAGTLQPTAGSLHAHGRIAALLELGSGFNPEFTGEENIWLNGAILGLSTDQIRERYDSIVAFAGLGDFIKQPVKTYSSGMAVRLAFSVAMSVDPDIFIVDEALAVGDIFFQQKCMSHMRERMRGKTRLFVSHDMHSICTLTERVLVLQQGKLILDGTPSEAVELYTKALHNETFGSKAIEAEQSLPPKPAHIVSNNSASNLPWVEVDTSIAGGAGEVVIRRVAITRDEGSSSSHVVSKGARVRAFVEIASSEQKDEIVVGYLVRDRVGVAIFGENTITSNLPLLSFQKGETKALCFEFVWPEIHPGEYTITIGVGEGRHPLQHTIQCWAQNIFCFEAISPSRVVHGIFNNPISHFQVMT